MSVTCGFYNSLNHDRKYDATQMSSIFDGIIKDGIFMSIGTHLTVTAGEGMFVTVGEGKAWFNHTWTLNDAELPLAVEVAELVLDRIDAVVLEVDSSEAVRDNSIKIIKGTPSSEPTNPVMENTETLHQYPLAYIYVKANATEITASDITNMIGTENTPFITGILETVNIDSLIAQWKSQWNDQIDANQREYDAWLLAQQTSFVTWREEEESTFEAWFENLRNQLDENQATNLQNQIDGIKDELKVTGGSRVVVTIDDKKGTYNVAGLFVSLTINGIKYSSLVGENKIAMFSGIVETGIAEIECYDNMQDFSASITLEIPYYGHYEATTKKINMYEEWLLTAGYTLDDYPEVSDIVNDYAAMYRMMNLHASVDYWVKWYNANNTILSNFTTSEVAMKAIGENDYAADSLMAIPAVLDALLASEHWEYILKDKVPKMTSNTTPEGEVSASSYLADGPAYQAFNSDVTNNSGIWHSAAGANQWIQYKFVNPTSVRKFKILIGTAGGFKANLQASNDGSNWVNLKDGLDFVSKETVYDIDLDNGSYYLYYRLNIPESYYRANNTQYVVLPELQFYGRKLHSLIPTMTSNTTPSGVASASSVYNDIYVPWKAFDNDFSENSAWHSNDKVNGEWLQIKLPSVKNVKRISLTNRNKAPVLPIKDFKLQGSNDGSYWNDLGTYINEKEGKNETSVFDVNNNDSYLYYRVYIMSSYGAVAVSIGELQFYGPDYEETVKPVVPGGFEYWLEAGGYTREQYPTVADVLADEKAVRKLMTVHTSCDAFVDWYNKDNSMLADFTANRVAMKWIGLRDYIADKLMDIPSALEQLLASEHWEYILKDKVPTMTSDTAPEGKAICSGYYSDSAYGSFPPYRAFDGVNSSAWVYEGTSHPWVGYKFSIPTMITRVYMVVPRYTTGTRLKDFIIEGSNDGTNWYDISGTLTFPQGTHPTTPSIAVENTYDISNDKYYLYYRVNTMSESGDTKAPNMYTIYTIQFYGRSLNESVPVMTSNTAPLGEVSASSVYQNTYAPYNVFGGSSSWYSALNVTLPQHIAYKFIKPIAVRKVCLRNSGAWIPKEFDIEGSNNGSDWVKLGSFTNQNTTERYGATEYFLENDKAFLNYRFVVNTIYKFESGSTEQCVGINELQFYGVSYSEEEFGSDGIEMLYDNGVEIKPITGHLNASGGDNGDIANEDDYVKLHFAGNSVVYALCKSVDLSNIADVLCEVKEQTTGAATELGIYTLNSDSKVSANVSSTRIILSTNKSNGDAPLDKMTYCLDVNSFSGINNVGVAIVAASGEKYAKLTKLYGLKS